VDCLLGDFYPLVAYQLNEDLWLAWQFDLPERQRGIVQVFRRTASIYESARFKLCGLDPDRVYTVTDLDQRTVRQQLRGRELLECGLLINAPGQPSARIISYEASK
jgi:alpha-galactosidase